MQFQECLTEASGEGRSWLCDTTLCTSQFCCETRQEVVLSLLWSQYRYWRKYAECICRQEDNVLRCGSRRDRANNVLNMIDRVGYTGVLGYALISEIDLAFSIQGNVLKQCITSDSVVDIRLRLFIQVDNLRIAAALEVEYTVVIPAVLVITDEKTLRVCRQSCFSCSGKTKEDSCVLSLLICVCRAVHGSDAL